MEGARARLVDETQLSCFEITARVRESSLLMMVTTGREGGGPRAQRDSIACRVSSAGN
jgi:hypothetical protein